MKKKPRNLRSRERGSKGPPGREGAHWIWGTHAVLSALANPERRIEQVLASRNAAHRHGLPPDTELIEPGALAARLPPGAVHQGLAARVQPLDVVELDALLEAAPPRLAVLDQISDPHNYGAIFRSAAAFGFAALIAQTRHAPPVTGVVAKSAAGALEQVADVRVVNIARTLEKLGAAGYMTLGLDGEAPALLAEALAGEERVAVVLGAEGAGLRPGVAKACQQLARIPMTPGMESLNVSNAAAIAFYEAARAQAGVD